MRILIVDEHEIYRAACAALLRTEGLDVADVKPGDEVIELAGLVEPEVVLLDAGPSAQHLHETVRQLVSLRCSPTVVLISSTGQDRTDPCLAALPFVAKADVCAAVIARAIADPSDHSPDSSVSKLNDVHVSLPRQSFRALPLTLSSS
ncbi:MAG: response regulator [Solirubrobacteraceae bacterium]